MHCINFMRRKVRASGS